MIELYVDISRPGGAIIQSLDVKTEISIRGLCRGSVVPMKIWPVEPIENAVSSPYFRKLSTSGITIAVGIGNIIGASTVLAFTGDADWTPVEANGVGYFQGILSLATDAIETAFTSNPASISSYFAIRLTDTHGPRVVYQRSVEISNTVLRQDSTTPVNADIFQTQAAALSIFPQWDNSQNPNNRGRGIVLLSSNGAAYMIRVDDDGSVLTSKID